MNWEKIKITKEDGVEVDAQAKAIVEKNSALYNEERESIIEKITNESSDECCYLAIWYEDSCCKMVTIKDYQNMLSTQNREGLAEFFYQRLYSRYLKPFEFDNAKFKKTYKNGFSIMANCCLLIETFQCFRKGIGDSRCIKNEELFKEFFNQNDQLSDFKDGFYKNVRCGILHQGETTGGWKIRRDGDLFDKITKTINAAKFLKEMEKVLKKYSDRLKIEEWDSEPWDNFRVKMRTIINNNKQGTI
jgi:hypothetical protein